jgi:hypothetical protein
MARKSYGVKARWRRVLCLPIKPSKDSMTKQLYAVAATAIIFVLFSGLRLAMPALNVARGGAVIVCE